MGVGVGKVGGAAALRHVEHGCSAGQAAGCIHWGTRWRRYRKLVVLQEQQATVRFGGHSGTHAAPS